MLAIFNYFVPYTLRAETNMSEEKYLNRNYLIIFFKKISCNMTITRNE